ncbi:PREDICTED: proactivator polypeptide-like 1 [Ipomoea nil]|uniref:proactivator polypeptide-like 1 n=1 Tax=Ipomoea nil TaxID=35883 RepID=UPI000900D5F8|nr:PREDICTED: proactivator polypeptide-like 1 [Ipomoea nil]
MDRRLCFVVVLVVLAISSWCCSAKDLAAADLKTQSLDVSEKQVEGSLCVQCKEFVTTYSDEQKQRELINSLHNYCKNIGAITDNPAWGQQCINNVDQTLPNIFEMISSSTPETICKLFCEGVVSISQYAESTEKQVQVSGNEDQCLKCKQLVVTYSDKQKQSQIINALHSFCQINFPFPQQCINQFEPILTNLFKLINSSTPESLCKLFNFCEGAVSISQQSARNLFSNMPLQFW